MKTFFRRTGVKAALCVLLVLCTMACFAAGAGVLLTLVSGAYDGSGTVFDHLAWDRMNQDANELMYGYFDPDDPARPWESRYGDGRFSGSGSNFVYRITDSAGKEVLSTWDGGTLLRSRTDDFFYSVTVENPAAYRYELPEPVFSVDGDFYGQDVENIDLFVPISPNVAQYISEYDTFPEYVYDYGFYYNGVYYGDFDGACFYADYEHGAETTEEDQKFTVLYGLRNALPEQDIYRNYMDLDHFLARTFYLLVGICAGAGLLALVLLVLLACNIARVPGSEEPRMPPILRVPLDVTAVIWALGMLLCLSGIFYVQSNLPMALVRNGCVLLAAAVLSVYAYCVLCARLRTGTAVRESLLYWLWSHLAGIGGALGRALGKAIRLLPLVWKVLAAYLILCVLECFGIVVFSYHNVGLLLVWMLEKLLLGALVGYVTLCFRRLKLGAERIAAGDYNAEVSETGLVLDFKDAAQTLNHIQDGMSAAVDSRLRSERMKTELITNVSHDLKTPLTSIVSYVDLLKQEPVGSEAAGEYLEVLDRQSQRLKKLIEDLVETSKATTGTLSLNLEALDFGMLLGQALGEYAARLEAAGLTLVSSLPEERILVQADGRKLWRVFDNLLGNAVKYALPGTRLYVRVAEEPDTVSVTFRNISRDELNVSAEELLERFVRGDASRHTDGSGLGLSIAKNLTEAMGGTFRLELDGDLFKVTVSMPRLPEIPEPV